MKTYSEREVFSREDMDLLRQATAIVDVMPHLDLRGREIRCHEVARVIGVRLGLKVHDGMYGLAGEREVPSAQHSWCETASGHILDVYAVGRVPPVQLVAVVRTLPPSFHRGDHRTDIRNDVMTWLYNLCFAPSQPGRVGFEANERTRTDL